MKILITILFALIVNAASANESILFMRTPNNITTAQAANAISSAAEKRRWTVEHLKNSQLRIKLNHRGYKAILDFSFMDHDIYYSDLTTFFNTDDIDSDEGEWATSSAPKNWVLNLKHDVSSIFTMVKINNSSKEISSSENMQVKLEKLKKLYDEKLITESEYESKKKEILSRF